MAGAAAGTAAGAYVLAQPVNRTMDFDTALRHAANTMYAGKSMNEKRAGMEEIKKSVMDAAYVGGTTPEAALEAMNTMVASGAMSGEAVKKLLPTVMKPPLPPMRKETILPTSLPRLCRRGSKRRIFRRCSTVRCNRARTAGLN